jgi:hypothetical protein
LTAVLDHQLRIGDEEVSEKIIAAYKDRGLQAPEHLENPPDIEPRFFVYWEAFKDLQTERRGRAIPIGAIMDYAERRGLDPDRLKRIVWEVDKTLLEHWENTDKAKAAQAEAEAEEKRRIAGGKS